VKILNIGSGPVTPGNTPGLEITNADRRDYEHVEVQDMEHLTYPKDSFDLVVCINALDHTPDAQAAIEEMIRVTKKWIYIDCALIQHTTSGKRHFWDVLEDGTFQSENTLFNIKFYDFSVEFIDNGLERRYNHVICRYSK
jgi:SAM-dependent methyltransferase